MVKDGNIQSVGLDELDQEHLAIFRSSEALREAASGDMPAPQLLQMFAKVLSEVTGHFENEEALLTPHRPHNMQAHIEDHARLIRELVALGQRAASGFPESQWRPEMVSLSDILFHHFITFDFEIRRHFADSKGD
jgi:hemerythrin-like metal-binding protein